MADRFPSLEEFDSGAQTETQGDSSFDSTTAAGDDFLTREKALLGDDANQFTSGDDNAAFVNDDDDLLGGGNGGGVEVTEFESSFPAIDTRNEGVAPGSTITGSMAPYQSSYTARAEDEEDPEVIKQWRERRDLSLQDRFQKSAQRQAETVKAAQQNIDDFYENYNSKKEKTIAQTRHDAKEFLENREDTSAGGTSWERIAKLVDLSGKGTRGGASGTGKERFRELLMSLKKDEKAPGATGY
jgi:hypothetical protein